MVYGIILLSLLTFFILISFLIPFRWKVKHTALIKASAEEVYDFLLHLKNWPQWQMKDEKDLTFLYVGPEKGEGAAQYWESAGTPACLRIGRCEHLISIHYQIRINRGETVLRWTLDFKNKKEFTMLTWECEGTSKKNPFDWFLTFFYKWKTKQEMKIAMERLQEINIQVKQLKRSA